MSRLRTVTGLAILLTLITFGVSTHPTQAQEATPTPDSVIRRLVDRMLLTHGVRSCFEYANSFARAKARAQSNLDVAPHLKFVDIGEYGYATVRLTGDEMRTEFVCIPPPITRATTPDGGPLRYRIVHTAKLWRAGERPQLAQQVLEGDPGLSI